MLPISNSILQPTSLPELNKRGIQLFVKRDDLIHKYISGNKWRKLRYAIEEALFQKKTGLLTFGGAYSNHLLATASAAHKLGLQSIGIVRGDELNARSNEVLKRCIECNMHLIFVSREKYSEKDSWEAIQLLRQKFSSFYIIPEGGAHYNGFIGCQEIWNEIDEPFEHIFLAAGTTTTACGMLLGLNPTQTLHVVPALKGFQTINTMRKLMAEQGISSDTIEDLLHHVMPHEDHHFGGYGKVSTDLFEVMERFYSQTQIPLDPVYTGKAFCALMDWLKTKDIRNVRVLFLHTGGVYAGKKLEALHGRKWS
jgi:1-aminocyclopropane-1-carboxylate deaminase